MRRAASRGMLQDASVLGRARRTSSQSGALPGPGSCYGRRVAAGGAPCSAVWRAGQLARQLRPACARSRMRQDCSSDEWTQARALLPARSPPYSCTPCPPHHSNAQAPAQQVPGPAAAARSSSRSSGSSSGGGAWQQQAHHHQQRQRQRQAHVCRAAHRHQVCLPRGRGVAQAGGAAHAHGPDEQGCAQPLPLPAQGRLLCCQPRRAGARARGGCMSGLCRVLALTWSIPLHFSRNHPHCMLLHGLCGSGSCVCGGGGRVAGFAPGCTCVCVGVSLEEVS